MERERNNYISYAFIVYVLQVALRVSLTCFLKRMHACMDLGLLIMTWQLVPRTIWLIGKFSEIINKTFKGYFYVVSCAKSKMWV